MGKKALQELWIAVCNSHLWDPPILHFGCWLCWQRNMLLSEMKHPTRKKIKNFKKNARKREDLKNGGINPINNRNYMLW